MARAVRREDCLGTAAAVDAKLLQVGSLQYMRWLPLKGPGGRQCQLATAAEVKLMDVPAYLGVGAHLDVDRVADDVDGLVRIGGQVHLAFLPQRFTRPGVYHVQLPGHVAVAAGCHRVREEVEEHRLATPAVVCTERLAGTFRRVAPFAGRMTPHYTHVT